MNAIEQGRSLYEQGLPMAAIGALQRGRDAFKQTPGAQALLANALRECWEFSAANTHYAEAIAHASGSDLAYRMASNYLIGLLYDPDASSQVIHERTAQWGGALPVAQPVPRATGSKASLRVGLLSADLCDHPVGFFLQPLLAHAAGGPIQFVMVRAGGRQDATWRSLQAMAPHIDVSTLGNSEMHDALRAQCFDVLIDLSGHTAGNRLPVLARRVAPLQLSWLGYPGTTGVPAIDAVLMDRWHVPTAQEWQYTEKVVMLDGGRLCFRPPEFAPPLEPPPCLAKGFVTFGCFNNMAKCNPAVLSAWADILIAVPNSRLLLKWRSLADPLLRQRVTDIFVASGVSSDRIELRPASTHVEMLRQYADIDVALDPYPFTGGHTSCEALWMGVPVVTLPGETAVSRQTYAYLQAIGRPEWIQSWIGQNRPDYIAKACRLAADPGELRRIRAQLRLDMRLSPLMDESGFARRFCGAILELVSRSGASVEPVPATR